MCAPYIIRTRNMPLDKLQHILIRSDDVKGAAKWFEDCLGLRHGGHPDLRVPLVSLHVGDVHAIYIALFQDDTNKTQRFQGNYLGGRGPM